MTIVFTKRAEFLRALRPRTFAILWTGQTISAFGNGVFLTALAWQVVLLTHSATALGIILIAQSIPLLIFLLIGGIAADRFPRCLVLFWTGGILNLILNAIALSVRDVRELT